ncbi:hypothetical protein GCM10028812_05700 [Ancylobacter sonchi]
MPDPAMRDIVERELVAPALIMQEAARRMVAKGHGRIVVFCPMSGKTGVHTKVAPFATAKGGLAAYLRVMAAEPAGAGVTVNTVATSLFESQVANLDPAERQELRRGIQVRCFGRADEAALPRCSWSRARSHFYCCGPAPMLASRRMSSISRRRRPPPRTVASR